MKIFLFHERDVITFNEHAVCDKCWRQRRNKEKMHILNVKLITARLTLSRLFVSSFRLYARGVDQSRRTAKVRDVTFSSGAGAPGRAVSATSARTAGSIGAKRTGSATSVVASGGRG